MTDVIQGTDEWHQIRLGKVTASRIGDVMMTKDKAGYQNYQAQLACERMTGVPTKTFKSAAMDQGNEVEPQARAVYEMINGVEVVEIGFVDHPDIPLSGCSPDGLIGTDGMVQFKCPEPKTHIKWLLGGTIDRRYLLQMQWEMACTGRKWNDFVSFNSDLPYEMQMFRKRIGRNEDTIAEMTRAAEAFSQSVDAMITTLQTKYPKAS